MRRILLIALAAFVSSPVAAQKGPTGSGCVPVSESQPPVQSAAGVLVDTADRIALRLNLPAFRLDVLRDSVVTQSFPVAVGEPRFRTPVGAFDIVRLIWNPWWYPPDAEWAKDEKITPPGRDNPMGKVKLQLRGTYYLHGTPLSASIGTAASHGCIRMRNADAITLARLVQSMTGAAITREETDSLITHSRPTRVVNLPRAVPLEIVYTIVEVRDTSLIVHPDIYERATSVECAILDALAQAGHDTTAVRRAALRDLVRRRRTVADTVALSDLLTSPSRPRSWR